MTGPEVIAEIQAALDAGPTPGPWEAASRGSYWHEEEADVRDADGEDIEQAEFVKPVHGYPTTRGQMYMRDAAFIAACNPANIAALLAHIKALEAERDAADKRCREAQAMCAGLQEELAARAPDVERYRWIRHGDNDETVLEFYSRHVAIEAGKPTMFLLRGSHLDAAIDAARAAGGGGG